MTNKSIVITGLIVVGSFLTGQSFAQEAGNDMESRVRHTLIEEVLVSAQKKSSLESIQDVPLAITGLTGDQVEELFMKDMRDVGLFVPNAQFYQSQSIPGVQTFQIRGLGNPDSQATFEPTVGLIKDGIFYGQRYGSFIQPFDVESIEVLRGPQGTLFGRNVIGGAVVVRSKRPQLAEGVSGTISGTAGTDSLREFRGLADVTLIDNRLGILASIADMKSDGTIKNVGPIGGTIGDQDIENYRLAATYNHDQHFDVTLIGELNRNTGDLNQTTRPDLVDDFFQTLSQFDNQINIKSDTYVIDSNFYLEKGTMTAIAGYRKTSVDQNGPTDNDGLPSNVLSWRTPLEHEQHSLEVRYATDQWSDRFDFTVGAFYIDQEVQSGDIRYLGEDFSNVQAGAARQESMSYALFAQADYYLTSSLTLTVGGRYTYEEKDFRIAPRSDASCGAPALRGTTAMFDFGDCVFLPEVSNDWSDFSPKVGLTWTINDDHMLYASIAKGYRSGGYNDRETPSSLGADGLPIPFDDEEIISYDLGIKSTFWNNRLRINAAAFYSEIDDLQRIVTGPPPNITQAVFNAGEATIEGLELELTGVVMENGLIDGDVLVLSGSAGYLNADYSFFDTDGDGISDSDHLKFSRASPFTSAVSIIYDFPLGEIGNLTSRVTYKYEKETQSDVMNQRPELPRFEEWDASIAFTDNKGALKVTLFVKNLTDAENIGQVLPIGGGVAVNPLPGRRTGLEISYSF